MFVLQKAIFYIGRKQTAGAENEKRYVLSLIDCFAETLYGDDAMSRKIGYQNHENEKDKKEKLSYFSLTKITNKDISVFSIIQNSFFQGVICFLEIQTC